VVILTTIGAKTGNIRKKPVMRLKDGDTYVAVASNGGAASNPSWYRNLSAHPEVSLQDGATVYRLRAREVRGEEKARWWLVAERDWPRFAEFRAKAGDREIPVVVLEPMETAGVSSRV
jgi:F420H(2)-dependent quinone reductase